MSAVFEKVGKSFTLSQEIEQQLEEAIRNKKFLAGEKLPTEKEMCEMFAVSRTALREALQMLSARGLINVRKGSGIYVNDYSPSNVIKPMSLFLELNFDKDYVLYVIEVRRMLEPGITRLAARNRTEDDLAALKKNLEKFRKCHTGNFRKEGELDRDFHMIIAKATGNPIIPVILDPIFQMMPKIRTLVYAEIDVAKSSALEYHEQVFQKIREQDENGAYDFMFEHLRIAEEHSRYISAELN